MIWALLAIVMILAVVIFLYQAPEPHEQLDKFIEENYREDIDFSLAAKGYPVVNDMDVQYSEYLARHPERIKL